MRKLTFILKICILPLCFYMMFSCEQSALINSTQKVPAEGWNAELPLRFRIDVTDTMQKYNCFLSVRHTKEYAWMNIFFFIKTTFPDKKIAVDTLECVLADYTGKWTGKGIGKYLDNQFLFKQNIRFPEQGSYTIEIFQGMRTEDLKNIESIGLKIIPSNVEPPNIPNKSKTLSSSNN